MPQYLGSTTPLTATSSYTSRWVNTDNSPRLSGSVFADQAGTLYIEQSGDGVNADDSVSQAITASTGASFTQTVVLPYMRLRYVNGATGQGTFRLFSKWILKGN